MNQELVIPKRCFQCGSVFDMGYDFVEGEGLDFGELGDVSSKEFLCYYCRDKGERIQKTEKLVGENAHWLTEEILSDEDY